MSTITTQWMIYEVFIYSIKGNNKKYTGYFFKNILRISEMQEHILIYESRDIWWRNGLEWIHTSQFGGSNFIFLSKSSTSSILLDGGHCLAIRAASLY